MKFETKLWQRSEKSFATTIPQALLFMIDTSKKYDVEWSFNPSIKKWFFDFKESKERSKEKTMTFLTSLWKRSQVSFATTIPHAVLLMIDEEKDYEAEWEFDQKQKKWVIDLKEVASR